ASRGCSELQSWDTGYYAEQLRQHRYAISQEELRPWFPVDRVLQGMFTTAGRLFGVELREVAELDRWHHEARLLEGVEGGRVIGRFVLELYARSNTRGGAWMGGAG